MIALKEDVERRPQQVYCRGFGSNKYSESNLTMHLSTLGHEVGDLYLTASLALQM